MPANNFHHGRYAVVLSVAVCRVNEYFKLSVIKWFQLKEVKLVELCSFYLVIVLRKVWLTCRKTDENESSWHL